MKWNIIIIIIIIIVIIDIDLIIIIIIKTTNSVLHLPKFNKDTWARFNDFH